jgi:putative transposase
MGFNRNIHHRKSIRLQGYDYGQLGLYFITVCTHERSMLFGEIIDGAMQLNPLGIMVEKMWSDLTNTFHGIKLHGYVTMPNHVHGIIEIVAIKNGVNSLGAINRAPTVGNIVRAFKARCTYAVNTMCQTRGVRMWQRNYYEHVIRNESAYIKIAEYIQNNPLQWQEDTYYLPA